MHISKFIFAVLAVFLVHTAVQAMEPPCLRELERDFFNANIVSQALAIHQVPQGAWAEINRNLQDNLRQVPTLLRKRAEKMNPNPLSVPFQWQAASHLLQDTLFDVFFQTISLYNVTNQGLNQITEGQARDMFNYIRDIQRQRLIACFGEENL